MSREVSYQIRCIRERLQPTPVFSDAVAFDSRAIDRDALARDRLTLCEDCPPVDYPTDKTRCLPCPRRERQEMKS